MASRTDSGFQVAWYTLGEVLNIAMARNELLLEAALRQMLALTATASDSARAHCRAPGGFRSEALDW